MSELLLDAAGRRRRAARPAGVLAAAVPDEHARARVAKRWVEADDPDTFLATLDDLGDTGSRVRQAFAAAAVVGATRPLLGAVFDRLGDGERVRAMARWNAADWARAGGARPGHGRADPPSPRAGPRPSGGPAAASRRQRGARRVGGSARSTSASASTAAPY